MKARKLLLIALTVVLAGCATPPEVKQLSVKQMEYFDAAITAVAIQSDALIIATEKLVTEAKIRIENEERDNRTRLTALIERGGLDQNQSADVADRIANRSAQAVAAKEKLDSDLDAIKSKSEELVAYIGKMKEVHLAIDAYVQSEKAGEVVLNDVLNQPSVKSMLSKVSELTPKIESGVADLTSLLDAL